jgi:hypothetical protein
MTSGGGREGAGALGGFDATATDPEGAAVADAVAEAVGVALAVGNGVKTGVGLAGIEVAAGMLLPVTVCEGPGSPILVRNRAAPAPSAKAAKPAAAQAAT